MCLPPSFLSLSHDVVPFDSNPTKSQILDASQRHVSCQGCSFGKTWHSNALRSYLPALPQGENGQVRCGVGHLPLCGRL